MYYHASRVKDIKELVPHISNHKKSYIYFSTKEENVLVYLSNAIEKFCKDNNFLYDGIWTTWASYGFDKDGIQVIEEYYPNALEETYKGVSGYIYYVNNIDNVSKLNDIPYAYISSENVLVDGFRYIDDAYLEILKEEEKGNIKIVRYNEFISKRKEWLINIIKNEYNNDITPEYKFFLENKFKDILEELNNK